MSELWQLGLDELSACVARGEASCVEAGGASLDRVAAVDDQVGAFLSLRSEAALREASEADRARAKGDGGNSPPAGKRFGTHIAPSTVIKILYKLVWHCFGHVS